MKEPSGRRPALMLARSCKSVLTTRRRESGFQAHGQEGFMPLVYSSRKI